MKSLTRDQAQELVDQLHLDTKQGILVADVQPGGFASELGRSARRYHFEHQPSCGRFGGRLQPHPIFLEIRRATCSCLSHDEAARARIPHCSLRTGCREELRTRKLNHVRSRISRCNPHDARRAGRVLLIGILVMAMRPCHLGAQDRAPKRGAQPPTPPRSVARTRPPGNSHALKTFMPQGPGRQRPTPRRSRPGTRRDRPPQLKAASAATPTTPPAGMFPRGSGLPRNGAAGPCCARSRIASRRSKKPWAKQAT